MNIKRNQHVVKHLKGWAVKGAKSSKANKVVNTQAETIIIAKKIAKNQASEMFIHGRDGKIGERNSYGKDPFPPKG